MFAKRTLPSLFLAIAMATAPQLASAQTHVDGAEHFVQELAANAVTTLSEGTATPEERLTQFRELFQEGFAVNGIARFALGRHWRSASPDEREEYLGLFEEAIVASWARRLESYSGEKIEIIDARDIPTNGKEKAAIVRAMIWTNPTSPIRVDWRVATNGEIYKVTDVVVAGVSMANTHRDEFAAVIRSNGNKISALNEVLRERSRG